MTQSLAGAERRTALATPLCVAVARVASEQFHRWRPGGGPALTETSPAAAPILREYYRVGIGQTVSDGQMRSPAFQRQHPWSAVFISYVIRRAGAGSHFHYSAAHQSYIRAARRNRLTADSASAFWAFRATEIAPQVGDLVCASRSESGATYDNIGDRQSRATHCDVVIEVGPGWIRVIGGNVGQTVGQKRLRTLPNGRLSLTGDQNRFFAVIRCQARGASSQTERVRHVMGLLVNRYGYPVNGAAGLVGNLIAESGVLPDRIEGSDAATPMRARDFEGRLRDFTPDEVRDRDLRRRAGPRLAGVGIAQWTSRDRRAGLFRHEYRGKAMGSAILSDLDAQVDYLVSELGRSYRGVDARLRSPGVTVDQASDVVLLRFEVPGSVLRRPMNDPAVQHVLGQRRAHANRALQIYRGGTVL